MKKKKLFLLASLAALAMTRPAERAVTRVESQEDLEDALADKASAIYIASSFNLTQSVTINSATTITSASDAVITSTAPIICKANTTFDGVKITQLLP